MTQNRTRRPTRARLWHRLPSRSDDRLESLSHTDNRLGRKLPHGRVGFTLVELVAVMAIMGIVFMVAQPRFSSFVVRDRVRRAAGRLQMDLRYTQVQAIQLRSRTGLVFNPAKDFYLLWQDDPAADWKGLRAAHTIGARRRPFQTSDQVVALGIDPDYLVAIESTTLPWNEIVFDAYGIPGTGGDIVLGAGRTRITVSIDGATGRTSVSDISETSTVLRIKGKRLPTASEVAALKP